MKKFDEIKLYCRTSKWQKNMLIGFPWDASRERPKAADRKLRYMQEPEVVHTIPNKIYSLELASYDTRHKSTVWIVGIDVPGCKQKVYVDLKQNEFFDAVKDGQVIDGNLVGDFEFVQYGAHVSLVSMSNGVRGQCKYWLKEYKKYNIFTDEELDGAEALTEGTDDDVNVCAVMVESRKADYYKAKFDS